jgi:hypothetical protein
MALYPADPNAPPVKSEPRVPSYLPPTIGADLPEIVVPPVDAAQPTSVGVAVADIPARLVSGNGVSVDADGLDFRLGLDIASLQIAEGQPADQWVPVWAVGRPVDEIVRAPVNVLRQDAPSDNTVYGRYNGTWAHLTVAWVDITGKPATFPATPHTHPESEVINLVSDLALKAPLASPALTGTPTAPTATPGDSTTLIATTAFVTAVDILKAPLASPALTGTPTAPTATPGTNTTQLATTAFVAALGALKANLASPVFTGDPQAPTPATADNDTSIATTAFVKAQAYAPLASPALTGTPTAPTATPGDSSTLLATTAFVTAVDILKAPLASPALTGNPTAPTQTPGDSSTKLATTAFVTTADNLKAPLASPRPDRDAHRAHAHRRRQHDHAGDDGLRDRRHHDLGRAQGVERRRHHDGQAHHGGLGDRHGRAQPAARRRALGSRQRRRLDDGDRPVRADQRHHPDGGDRCRPRPEGSPGVSGAHRDADRSDCGTGHQHHASGLHGLCGGTGGPQGRSGLSGPHRHANGPHRLPRRFYDPARHHGVRRGGRCAQGGSGLARVHRQPDRADADCRG